MQHLPFFFFFSRKISEDDVIALLRLHKGPSPYMQPVPGCITLQMRFHLAFTFPLLYKFQWLNMFQEWHMLQVPVLWSYYVFQHTKVLTAAPCYLPKHFDTRNKMASHCTEPEGCVKGNPEKQMLLFSQIPSCLGFSLQPPLGGGSSVWGKCVRVQG